MGVTIHYGGYLKDGDCFEPLMERVRDVVADRGWEMLEVAGDRESLIRVKGGPDGKVVEYESEVNGVILFPHKECEWLRILFDEEGFVQGFVKTQFAPIEIHCQIVELFDRMTEYLRDFWVEDEGGYWESRDVNGLAEKIDFLNKRIRALDTPEGHEKIKRIMEGEDVDLDEFRKGRGEE